MKKKNPKKRYTNEPERILMSGSRNTVRKRRVRKDVGVRWGWDGFGIARAFPRNKKFLQPTLKDYDPQSSRLFRGVLVLFGGFFCACSGVCVGLGVLASE